MGPVIIFDKSAFQSLTLDEAVWLDALYLSNITPLFFIEMLADLTLETARGRTAEQVVGDLANKTPEMSVAVNADHRALFVNDLLGNPVAMEGRPVVGGMAPARTSEGRLGFSLSVRPEQRAFQRWARRAFDEVEREYAREWRARLTGIDLRSIYAQYRPVILSANPRPRDLDGIKDLALAIVEDPQRLKLPNAIWLTTVSGIPLTFLAPAIDAWLGAGSPPLQTHAPYAAHVVLVDLVFNLAVGAELIGRERPSNKVDIGYLYYLPFCQAFTSRDRLHRRMAPLFLGDDQVFVDGDDLKSDLGQLDTYFAALPEDVKESGVMRFAASPPLDGEFLTNRLWDRYLPRWRPNALAPLNISDRAEREIAKELLDIRPIPPGEPRPAGLSDSTATFLKIERRVPLKKGKWRLLPPSVESDPTP